MPYYGQIELAFDTTDLSQSSANIINLILTLSCRSIYPMSSLKVFYHKLDYYNDVHISLEILNVFQPNLAEIWLMHYSVIKR